MSLLRSTVVWGFVNKPIRLLEDLMLAKPRLRSVINSLTFIVTRTIRHKGKENKVFSPFLLFRNKPVRLVEDWRNLIKIVRTQSNVFLSFVSKKQKALHYLSFRQTVAQHEESLTTKHQPADWCFSFYLSNIKFLSFHIFQVGFYFFAYLAVFGG